MLASFGVARQPYRYRRTCPTVFDGCSVSFYTSIAERGEKNPRTASMQHDWIVKDLALSLLGAALPAGSVRLVFPTLLARAVNLDPDPHPHRDRGGTPPRTRAYQALTHETSENQITLKV